MYTTIPLAKGLAQFSNTIIHDTENCFSETQNDNGEVVLTYTRFSDSKRFQNLSQWDDALRYIDQALNRFLNNNVWGELTIYCCMGKSFHINRKRLRNLFWRSNINIFKVISGMGINRKPGDG
jgi:hypothetical protein